MTKKTTLNDYLVTGDSILNLIFALKTQISGKQTAVMIPSSYKGSLSTIAFNGKTFLKTPRIPDSISNPNIIKDIVSHQFFEELGFKTIYPAYMDGKNKFYCHNLKEISSELPVTEEALEKLYSEIDSAKEILDEKLRELDYAPFPEKKNIKNIFDAAFNLGIKKLLRQFTFHKTIRGHEFLNYILRAKALNRKTPLPHYLIPTCKNPLHYSENLREKLVEKIVSLGGSIVSDSEASKINSKLKIASADDSSHDEIFLSLPECYSPFGMPEDGIIRTDSGLYVYSKITKENSVNFTFIFLPDSGKSFSEADFKKIMEKYIVFMEKAEFRHRKKNVVIKPTKFVSFKHVRKLSEHEFQTSSSILKWFGVDGFVMAGANLYKNLRH